GREHADRRLPAEQLRARDRHQHAARAPAPPWSLRSDQADRGRALPRLGPGDHHPRPSLVYGPGSRGVFTKLAGLVRRLPIIPVVGPGRWHLRPLYLDDMTSLIAATLARPDTAGRTYDVGGPDRVTYDGFLLAICSA